jgi:hypothetical protein
MRTILMIGLVHSCLTINRVAGPMLVQLHTYAPPSHPYFAFVVTKQKMICYLYGMAVMRF